MTSNNKANNFKKQQLSHATGGDANLSAAISDATIDRSIAALNAADLGLANLDELETLIGAIDAIAEKDDRDPAAMTKQLRTIRRLAHFGRFFAAERSEDLQCMRDEIADEHAALKAGAA
jgi:hypothetical protein